MEQAIITNDTPLWQLTVGQLAELIEEKIKTLMPTKGQADERPRQEKRYAHSLDEFAKALGVSTPTACKIKNSGAIDSAVSQWRRTIIIDIDKAIKLLAIEDKRQHKSNKR